MPIQPKTRRPDMEEPRGIPDAAIEGAMEVDETSNADKFAQPGPGLSDSQAEANRSANKRNPDIEKFHDGSEARGRELDEEWEVLEE